MGKSLIKIERYLTNLRQVDHAAKTSIPQARISRIGNGVAIPTAKEKPRLAKAFGLPRAALWPEES